MQNEEVKRAVGLREPRERKKTGLFLIEGYRECKRAIERGWDGEIFFFCPSLFLGENETALLQASCAEKIECSLEVFQKLSYRDRPDGLLLVAKQRHRRLQDLQLLLSPFFLVAEKIEKPGNLGTILRSADAAGVDAVLVADPTTDIFNPNVVRSSVGTLFTVPVVQASSEEVLAFLAQHHIPLLAATPHAQREYTEVSCTGPLAIAVGSEQYGLSKEWREQASIEVKIPMLGVADSLNVASATTLLLYEVVRQRRLHGR